MLEPSAARRRGRRRARAQLDAAAAALPVGLGIRHGSTLAASGPRLGARPRRNHRKAPS